MSVLFFLTKALIHRHVYTATQTIQKVKYYVSKMARTKLKPTLSIPNFIQKQLTQTRCLYLEVYQFLIQLSQKPGWLWLCKVRTILIYIQLQDVRLQQEQQDGTAGSWQIDTEKQQKKVLFFFSRMTVTNDGQTPLVLLSQKVVSIIPSSWVHRTAESQSVFSGHIQIQHSSPWIRNLRLHARFVRCKQF